MAWIGDEVSYERRQEVLARLLGSTVLGMMAGSWAGGAITQALGWRAAFFFVAALFIVAAVVLSLSHLRERKADHATAPHSYFEQVGTVLGSPWARENCGAIRADRLS